MINHNLITTNLKGKHHSPSTAIGAKKMPRGAKANVTTQIPASLAGATTGTTPTEGTKKVLTQEESDRQTEANLAAKKAADAKKAKPAQTPVTPGDTVTTVGAKKVSMFDLDKDMEERGDIVVATEAIGKVLEKTVVQTMDNMRSMVGSAKVSELFAMSQTANTAGQLSILVSCMIHHELVNRMRKIALKSAAMDSGVIDDKAAEKAKGTLMAELASELKISAVSLYQDAQIWETYFTRDFDTLPFTDWYGNALTQERIEDAAKWLTKTFFFRCMPISIDEEGLKEGKKSARAKNPYAALLLAVEFSQKRTSFTVKDCIAMIAAINAGEDPTDEKVPIEKPEGTPPAQTPEDAARAQASANKPGASQRLASGIVANPDLISADAFMLISAIYNAAKLAKEKNAPYFAHRDSASAWGFFTERGEPGEIMYTEVVCNPNGVTMVQIAKKAK